MKSLTLLLLLLAINPFSVKSQSLIVGVREKVFYFSDYDPFNFHEIDLGYGWDRLSFDSQFSFSLGNSQVLRIANIGAGVRMQLFPYNSLGNLFVEANACTQLYTSDHGAYIGVNYYKFYDPDLRWQFNRMNYEQFTGLGGNLYYKGFQLYLSAGWAYRVMSHYIDNSGPDYRKSGSIAFNGGLKYFIPLKK